MIIDKIYHLRKLILSINLSLDGCFAGPDNELDWHFRSWTPEMSRLWCELLNGVDTIVLGRNTYLEMARYWRNLGQDVHFPRDDYPLAVLMNRCTKIVFSKTPDLPVWENSKVISTVAEIELMKMKEGQGTDMIVLGSGLLVQSLISAGMIDEMILWIHPVVLNEGKVLFTTMSGNSILSLRRTVQTDSGVVVFFYAVSQSAA